VVVVVAQKVLHLLVEQLADLVALEDILELAQQEQLDKVLLAEMVLVVIILIQAVEVVALALLVEMLETLLVLVA
jgi:hypothetical protein